MPAGYPEWVTFAIAGNAGAAGWMFCHPIDLTKVRIQLSGQGGAVAKTAGQVISETFKSKGFFGFYDGLTAALTRQYSYGMLRLSLYDIIRRKVDVPGEEMHIMKKLGVGLTAGGIAASTCCPVEVVLVRMQAQATPGGINYGYNNIGHGLFKLFREEGIAGGWRGVTPTVTRGMVVSMTQLSTYDHAKTMLSNNLGLEGMRLNASSSLVAALIYCYTSLPFDIAKTRIQNQQAVNGVMPIKGIGHAFVDIVKTEGFFRLWKGFGAYFARGGLHSVLMLNFSDIFKKWARDYYAQDNQQRA